MLVCVCAAAIFMCIITQQWDFLVNITPGGAWFLLWNLQQLASRRGLTQWWWLIWRSLRQSGCLCTGERLRRAQSACTCWPPGGVEGAEFPASALKSWPSSMPTGPSGLAWVLSNHEQDVLSMVGNSDKRTLTLWPASLATRLKTNQRLALTGCVYNLSNRLKTFMPRKGRWIKSCGKKCGVKLYRLKYLLSGRAAKERAACMLSKAFTYML